MQSSAAERASAAPPMAGAASGGKGGSALIGLKRTQSPRPSGELRGLGVLHHRPASLNAGTATCRACAGVPAFRASQCTPNTVPCSSCRTGPDLLSPLQAGPARSRTLAGRRPCKAYHAPSRPGPSNSLLRAPGAPHRKPPIQSAILIIPARLPAHIAPLLANWLLIAHTSSPQRARAHLSNIHWRPRVAPTPPGTGLPHHSGLLPWQ